MEDNSDAGVEAAQAINDEALSAHFARRGAMKEPGKAPSSKLCDECGFEISPGRLEAVPFTRLCIECAEMEAKRRQHFAHG